MHILNCNIRCWECSKNCPVKESFQLPEFLFNQLTVEWTQTYSGYLMTRYPFLKKELVEEVKITCVSLKLAREQYLKNPKS